MTRYFIGSDNSGHEYAVPVQHRQEWYRWTELSEDDEDFWETPEWAMRIDGNFTFSEPGISDGRD